MVLLVMRGSFSTSGLGLSPAAVVDAWRLLRNLRSQLQSVYDLHIFD